MIVPLVSSAFLATLAHVGVTDARERRIPNVSVLILLALYPVHAATGGPRSVVTDVGLAVSMLLVGVTLWRLRLLGGGDAKLLAALSLWAGTSGFWSLVQVTALVGGALAVAVWLRREHGWRLAAAVPPGLAGIVIGPVPGGRQHEPTRSRHDAASVPYGVALAVGGAWIWLEKLVG